MVSRRRILASSPAVIPASRKDGWSRARSALRLGGDRPARLWIREPDGRNTAPDAWAEGRATMVERQLSLGSPEEVLILRGGGGRIQTLRRYRGLELYLERGATALPVWGFAAEAQEWPLPVLEAGG